MPYALRWSKRIYYMRLGIPGTKRIWYMRLGSSVAQLVVRWPAVRQARVQLSARHPREGFPMHCKKNRRTSPSYWAWSQTNLSGRWTIIKYISIVGKFRRNRTSPTKWSPLTILKTENICKSLHENWTEMFWFSVLHSYHYTTASCKFDLCSRAELKMLETDIRDPNFFSKCLYYTVHDLLFSSQSIKFLWSSGREED